MEKTNLKSSVFTQAQIVGSLDGLVLARELLVGLQYEFIERFWKYPSEGWLPDELARNQAVEQLTRAVLERIHRAWDSEVPEELWPKIQREVENCIRKAVSQLTRLRYGPDCNVIGYSNFIEAYWEPAEASVPIPESMTELQIQAYQWAAAIIGVEVRNSPLEDIHALYTSNACMPLFNRGVRAAAFDVMLADEWLGYYLGEWPGFALFLKANGVPIPLPNAVGQAQHM